MSRKKVPKKKATAKQEKPKTQYMPLSESWQYFGIDRRWLYLFIVLTGLLFYANTIPNKYALDDGIVVTKNRFTQKGLRGIPEILAYDTMAGEHGKDVNFVQGGRYRPLSVITLAIEYELFDQNPHISHFINALFYGLTGLLIFLVFSRLLRHEKFRPHRNKWFLSIPFVASMLFIIHPVHSEVVANIKGRDEILAVMGGLGAFWYYIRYHETGTSKHILLSALMIFLGLLSKENAITFLAIIPLGIWFFTDRSLMKNLKSLLPLIAATVLFLIIRRIILGTGLTGTTHELMNNPFVHATTGERYATVALTLGKYLQLLVFPHPLTWDYYPYHIPLVDWGDWRAIVPFIINLAIVIYALVNLKKKQHLFSFSIWTYFAGLSIVSNIFFIVGSFMSERFLYLPSIGFSLIVAYLLAKQLPAWLEKKQLRPKPAMGTVLGIFLVLFSLSAVKTIDRNEDWEDNFTLFTHDVKISSESAKSNTTAGEQLLLAGLDEKNDSIRKAYFEQSEEYLKKAIRIHPKYIAPRLDLGLVYEHYKKEYKKAVDMYISTLKLNPNYEKAFKNIRYMFERRVDSVDFQIETYERVYKINPKRYHITYTLGSLYGAYKNNLEEAIFYLKKAVQINPRGVEAFTDLGVAYAITQQYKKAIRMLERAAQLNADDPLVYSNLSKIHQRIGNKQKAARYAQKAKQLQAKQQRKQQQRQKQLRQQQQEQ